MITRAQLAGAKEKIAHQFLSHCAHGAQTKGLPPECASCGQYLGLDSPQRGIHGTSAALRVLADHSPAASMLPRIVKYLSDRYEVESAVRSPDDFSRHRHQLELDDLNVIKISEALYALHFVRAAQAETERLKRILADRLIAGRIAGKGWDYFTDRPSRAELLPSAHAIRALSTAGYGVSDEAQALYQVVKDSRRQRPTRADISVQVFCLFVLAFTTLDPLLVEDRVLRRSLRGFWRKLEPLLNEDVEQNVEYFRGEEHFYVRVPWQLYLLALAAKLEPLQYFASVAAQRRLGAILDALDTTTGYIYPHSGSVSSARTMGIVYDVFAVLDDQVERKKLLLAPAYGVDYLRSLFTSPWLTRTSGVVAVVLASVAVRQWSKTGSLKDLAPDLISSVLLFLMSVAKYRH